MPVFQNTDTEFIKKVSRREVDRGQRRIIGITASTPRYKILDDTGRVEFVVDVRVGVKENQGFIPDVLVASWAQGIITDFNIPVLMERSPAGRLAIIARAEIRLPDVAVDTYSYGSLKMPFAAQVIQQSDGTYKDAFGFPANDPNEATEVSQLWIWTQGIEEVDDIETPDGDILERTTAKWVEA